MESEARFAVISLERTKWVHKGYSGMKGKLPVVSAPMLMQDMSGRGTPAAIEDDQGRWLDRYAT